MEVNWTDLETQFELALGLASEPICQNEIDAHRICLILGQKPLSLLEHKLNHGSQFPRTAQLEAFQFATAILASPTSTEEEVPKWGIPPRSHVATVREGIQKKQLSIEFVYSWGMVERAAGILANLVGEEPNKKAIFARRWHHR